MARVFTPRMHCMWVAEQEAGGGGGAWDCLPNGPRVVVVARPADEVVERHWQARWKYAFLHSRRAHGGTSWVALPTGVERQCQAAIGAYVRRRVRDRVDGAHKTRVGVRRQQQPQPPCGSGVCCRSGVRQQQGLVAAAHTAQKPSGGSLFQPTSFRGAVPTGPLPEPHENVSEPSCISFHLGPHHCTLTGAHHTVHGHGGGHCSARAV
jgi:hypothetical protein